MRNFAQRIAGLFRPAGHGPTRAGTRSADGRPGVEWETLSKEVLALLNAGEYDRGVVVAIRALHVAEENFGHSHHCVSTSLNGLASLYTARGEYAEAEPLYQRALAIREGAFGPDHAAVATSLNNLALLYKTQGLYAQAETLSKRFLAIREKALGPDHPSVAGSLNNLALLYETQGLYAQAEQHYTRGLAIWQKVLGPDHPSVAANLNNLAALYGLKVTMRRPSRFPIALWQSERKPLVRTTHAWPPASTIWP